MPCQPFTEAIVTGAIENREIITAVAGGTLLRGTYHKPREKSVSSLNPGENNRIGVLFMNAGVMPRAGAGDTTVIWADSLARSGYAAFRFDLPGLGDSDEDSSIAVADFQSCTDAGAYGPVLSSIVTEIVERFNLSSIVVIGTCSGAVTGLYAAAANERIKGLVLLDLYFHLPQENGGTKAPLAWHARITRRLLGGCAAPSKLCKAGLAVLSYSRNIYYRLSRNRILVRRKTLPDNANLPLINCATQLATSGVPMLILRSASFVPKAGEFDYVGYLQRLSGRNGRISVNTIQGVSHAFVERKGNEFIRSYTEQWLHTCFSLTRRAEIGASEDCSPQLTDALLAIDTDVH